MLFFDGSDFLTKGGIQMKAKAILILMAMLIISGCGTIKFGAGIAAQALVHQGNHLVYAKISGIDIKWRDGFNSIPGFQPVVQLHKGSKPEPLAYGGPLFTEAAISEFIMWKTDVLKDEEGEKFLTDFWMGFLFGTSLELLKYGSIRSGLFGDHNGEGQNDLNRENFGPGHELAGALCIVEGARIARELIRAPRTKAYWDKFLGKLKMWIDGTSVGMSYLF
jgi:hypothetical protein